MTITGWQGRVTLAALMLLLPIVSPAASAAVEEDSYSVEFYAGSYQPGPDLLDGDLTGGIRANFNAMKNFAVTTQLGYFTTESAPIMGLAAGEIDYKSYLFDVSFNGYLAPDSRCVVALYGGFGGAFTDTTFATITPSASLSEFSDNTLTGNVGVGFLIDLNDKFFLRPDAKLRYFENRSDDEWDAEYTLSIGWKADY